MSDYLFWLLFSLRGRVGRGPFAGVFLFEVVVGVVFQLLLLPRYLVVTPDALHKAKIALNGPPAVGAILVFLGLVLAWISFANKVKRLHDFGWSGAWLFAPAGVIFVGALLAGLFAVLGFRALSVLFILVAVAGGILGILALTVMMFFRRGDDGENSHPRGPEGSDTAPFDRASHAPRAAPAAYVSTRPAQQGFGRRGLRP